MSCSANGLPELHAMVRRSEQTFWNHRWQKPRPVVRVRKATMKEKQARGKLRDEKQDAKDALRCRTVRWMRIIEREARLRQLEGRE